MSTLLGLFFIILTSVKVTYACNGYALKMNYIKACADTSIVQPKNVSVVMDKDCNLIFTGCLRYTKTLKTSKGTYEINKPPMPSMKGPVDTCELAGSRQYPEIQQGFRALGLPNKCPISAGLKCGKGDKLNLGPLKNQIGLAAGTTTVRLDLEHDVGTSCVEFSMSINKPRKG